MIPAKRGQKIRDVITARAWNQLNKSKKEASEFDPESGRHPNIVVTGYDNNPTMLPRFSTVALANPLFPQTAGMTDDDDPLYDNLEFQLSRTLYTTSSLGITQQPLGQGLSCKVVIHGATWAKINITDPSANWADIDTNNRLKTTGTGIVKILWKPSGLGVKQCLVLLGVANKASGSGGICYLNTALTARTTSPNTLGSASASKVLTDSSGNILGYEPGTIIVWNTTKITQAQSTLCQYKEPSPNFYLVDVGDCSVLDQTLTPINPVPSPASGFNNSLQINLSIGAGP